MPGVEASTGSLGHGLSIGVGMALAARMRKRANRVFVIMGDGEIDEGSVWEAAICAGKHAFPISLPSSTTTKSNRQVRPRRSRNSSRCRTNGRRFGFATVEVDGHDVGKLRDVFRKLPLDAMHPTTVICHTVKGKGFPFAEHDPDWHHKSRVPSDLGRQLYAALESH